MPPTPLDRAFDVAARRCYVPRQLDSVTTYGTEMGHDETAEEIWSLVQSVYRTGMHPGIQICIRHHGDVVLNRAIGHARGNIPGRRFDPDRATTLTVDTPVNLFSAAKAVTGMVMHKLEEQGVLSLDDRVADHVPGFGLHGKNEVTIRHVLTHRAGIATLPADAFDLDLLLDYDHLEEIICDLRPTGPAGERQAYHAVTGGFVMELVARRATGRSLRDVLATEIKDPLGLDWFDFGVDPEHTELVAQNVETGFPPGWPIGSFMQRVLGKRWGPVLRLSNDPRFLAGVIPSANVIVTAIDVATFYQCLMNGGTIDGARVFEEETVKRAVRGNGPDVTIDRMLGLPMRYSSGFMLGSESVSLFGWNKPEVFGHVGMSNLFTWADPTRDLVVALLTTGKPVIGTHIPALIQLISSIHQAFPERE